MSFEIFVFKYKIRAESRLAWLTSENAFGLFRQREPSYLLQTSFMFYFTLYFYQKHFLLHFSFSFYFFHGISQSEEKQDTGRIDIIINGDNAPNLEIIFWGFEIKICLARREVQIPYDTAQRSSFVQYWILMHTLPTEVITKLV